MSAKGSGRKIVIDHVLSEQRLNDRAVRNAIAMTFGGREAEIMTFGPEKVTNGATGDIQQATGLETGQIRHLLRSAREKLLAEREKRVRPGRDEKILP